MTGFGAHDGHAVHPHNHKGQDRERRHPANWCSGRWLCASCADRKLFPQGTWFDGPECKPPAVKDGTGKKG